MAPGGSGHNGLGASVELTFSFGPFRLSPRRQLFLKGETPVPLGSRAFEILLALVERAGEVVDKNSLMTRAWPDLTVEEANLRAQITALRRVLAEGGTGANYVVTFSGCRGAVTLANLSPTKRHLEALDISSECPNETWFVESDRCCMR